MHKRLLDGNTLRRFGHLLDMLYTPAEVAEEIGVDTRMIYERLLPAGLPNTKDDAGHIWIHGIAAKRWALAQRKARHHLAVGEGFCVHCKAVVKLNDSKREHKNGVDMLRGKCPKCEHTIVRLLGRTSA